MKVKAERTEGQEIALALHRIGQALERLAAAHERRADAAAKTANDEFAPAMADLRKMFEGMFAGGPPPEGGLSRQVAERHV